MSKAYQYTVYTHLRNSLLAIENAKDELFDCQANSRTLKIVNNINKKMMLLKDERVKQFKLNEPVADQFSSVVEPLIQVITDAQLQNNPYLVLESDKESEKESEHESNKDNEDSDIDPIDLKLTDSDKSSDQKVEDVKMSEPQPPKKTRAAQADKN